MENCASSLQIQYVALPPPPEPREFCFLPLHCFPFCSLCAEFRAGQYVGKQGSTAPQACKIKEVAVDTLERYFCAVTTVRRQPLPWGVVIWHYGSTANISIRMECSRALWKFPGCFSFLFFCSQLEPYSHTEFRLLSIPEAGKDTFLGYKK